MQIIKGKAGFYASVEASLDELDPNWKQFEGLLITGSHSPEDFNLDEALAQIKEAREKNLPVLGICFGLQLMVIEFARNVLNLPLANSTEIDPKTPAPVVTRLPGFRTGIFPVAKRFESHWHQYSVNPDFVQELSKHFKIHLTDNVVEMMWLPQEADRFYLGVQFHPEYQSSKTEPHPVFAEFIKRCQKK